MFKRIAILTLFFSACILQGGVIQTVTTSIRGVVFDPEGNRPIAKAGIELQNQSGEVLYVATTREDGRFSIPNVVQRQYKMIATRNGYVAADAGDQARGGRNVTVTPDLPEIQIAMTRTASISGRITDRVGQPLVHVNVQALKLSYDRGRRRMMPVAASRTTDLGDFRIFWLPPGRYYVRAIPVATSFDMGVSFTTNPSAPERNRGIADFVSVFYQGDSPLPAAAGTFGRRQSSTEALVPVYLPGTIQEGEAVPLDLKPGQDYRGADISVVPARWYKVKGLVVDGVTQMPAPKSLITRVALPASGTYFTDEVEPSEGRFEISALPGRYSLFAYTTSLTGRVEVEVKDRDIDGLVITINPPATLPATISIDGRPAPGGPEMSSLRVHLGTFPDLPGSIQINSRPDANGSLSLPYLQPGKYRVAVEPFEGIPPQGDSQTGSRRPPALVGRDGSRDGPLPPIANSPNRPFSALSPLPAALSNAYIKRIRFGDAELPDGVLNFDTAARERQDRDPRPLEIIIGLDGGSVEGTVSKTPNANVVLVPNGPLRSRLDLYKSTLTDASGLFRVTGVAPGDYKVFVWSFAETGAWFDPDFLKTVEGRATPVHVNAGTASKVDLPGIP
jgi:hypothetical protein